MFNTEVAAARFFAVERIDGDELAHGDEVVQTDGLVELNVDTFELWNEEVGLKFLADVLQFGESRLEAFLRASHTYVFPHHVAEFLVDAVNRLLTLDVEQVVDVVLNGLFSSLKFRQVG